MRNKFIFRSAFVFVFLLSILPQVAITAEKVFVQEILSNPDKYDGQEVTIEGKASKVKPKTSRGGNEYTSFTLIDNSGKGITIFTWGHPGIRDGQKLTIIGIYQKVKKVGRYTFYNEVEAKDIR